MNRFLAMVKNYDNLFWEKNANKPLIVGTTIPYYRNSRPKYLIWYNTASMESLIKYQDAKVRQLLLEAGI